MNRITNFPQHVSDARVQKSQPGTFPLLDEWQKKHHPIERKTKTRPMTQTDRFSPNEFDEILDWEEEQERTWRTITLLEVPREREDFTAARKELYLILRLYEDAAGLWQTRYRRERARLLDAGYSEEVLATVPEPPPEIPLLHTEGCGDGQIWEGYTEPEGTYTRLFCRKCRWTAPHYSPETLYRHRPVMIPCNPDYEESHFASTYDEDEGATEHLRAESEAGLIRTRKCLKLLGLVISVTEAARILHTSTQNVSNYLAKHRLHSWPDPDDSRYRLLLRSEVEAFGHLPISSPQLPPIEPIPPRSAEGREFSFQGHLVVGRVHNTNETPTSRLLILRIPEKLHRHLAKENYPLEVRQQNARWRELVPDHREGDTMLYHCHFEQTQPQFALGIGMFHIYTWKEETTTQQGF